MKVRFHPHAIERMLERGASEEEVAETVQQGERFPAKLNRVGFRRNFPHGKEKGGRKTGAKQIEVYAVKENSDWLVITVIVKYF